MIIGKGYYIEKRWKQTLFCKVSFFCRVRWRWSAIITVYIDLLLESSGFW